MNCTTRSDELISRIRKAVADREVVSLALCGQHCGSLGRLAAERIRSIWGRTRPRSTILGPAATILCVGLSYEASNKMMAEVSLRVSANACRSPLRRQVDAINRLTADGMYFDYGNAFPARKRRVPVPR